MSTEHRDPAPVGLRLGGAARAGEDRLRLLEAIARRGTLTAAGKDLGLGYRATWDAVQTLNNLFPKPLVHARPGGRSGGNAGLTPEGEAVLKSLRHVQVEIDLAVARLRARLADDPSVRLDLDPWSLIMRTSARNALRGVVKAIEGGRVSAEVIVDVGQGIEIVAVITRRSVADLGLAVGVPVTALIKASLIILAAGDAPLKVSARNRLPGVVVRVEPGGISSEVVLELADGKTLAATLTRHGAEDLDLKPGDRATALIKASHVILAVE